jgi:hypothetical protein
VPGASEDGLATIALQELVVAQDDGLRRLFRQHLVGVHWASIETGITEPGVPDLNGCSQGVEFWVECKATSGWTVTLRPEQIGWLDRRTRAGGRTFVAVRRHCSAGAHRSMADEIWLYPGHVARRLELLGLKGLRPYAHFTGGPANWDWERLGIILLGQRLKNN